MRSLKFGLSAALILGMVGVSVNGADDKVLTVKEVMKKGHSAPKGQEKLCAKVVGGKATADEKKMLLALYIDLDKNKAPKGDEKDWKEKTTAMVVAAKEVVAGKDGAEKKLGDAINCMACHKEHRPAKK